MTWRRLEAVTVDPGLLEGEEARVGDPLWLLGRQWQVGELTGDDAGTPVLVEATLTFAPVSRFQPGAPEDDGPVVDVMALGVPLETAVEREEVRAGAAAVRLVAEAGLQLQRMLDAAGVRGLRAPLRAAHPLTLPPDDGLDARGRAQLDLLVRRSFDARALHAKVAGGGQPAIAQLQGGAGRQVLDAWVRWYAGLVSEPPAGSGSWRPRRMEHSFRAAAHPEGEAELVLDAAEYPGGHLDWHAFDVRPDLPSLGAPEASQQRRLRVIPTPARYAGQAAARFWQVEDAAVSFTDLHVAPEDLARVAVGAFGVTFGEDWLLIPCRLPVGVVARLDGVVVHDTFGQTHRIRSCAEYDGPGRPWRFFELTGDPSADAAAPEDRTSPWLLLAPALPGVVSGRPLEEVVLTRDDAANLAWAAELRVESAAGRPVDRAAHAVPDPAPPPPAPGAWSYRLGEPVADHLVPLVPVRAPDGRLSLQRGRLAVSSQDGTVSTTGARGTILEPRRRLLIDDGEVPAAGIRVTRSWQLARTPAGESVLWVGRRKGAASPRRSPGVTFDRVRRETEPGGG